MAIFDITKTKLDNDTITDTQIQSAIDEVTQVVYNYCHIDTMPEALNYTVANMSVDLINYQHGIVDVAGESLSSISIGDQDLSFKDGAGGGTSHSGNLDSITMNYSSQLQGFRTVI